MNKLSNLIKKADLVGIEIKPTLRENNRVRSVFGGFLSLIAIGFSFFGFIYYGLIMVRRENPIMNVVQNLETQAVTFTKDNPFVIMIADRTGRLINQTPGLQRAIQIDVELQEARPDSESGYKVSQYYGKMKPCDSTEMSEKIYRELQQAGHPIELGLCHDNSSFVDTEGNPYEGDIYLKNRHADIDSSFIHYKVRKCDETKDPDCMKDTVPLSDIAVIFFKLNYYIDQEDFSSPVKVDMTQQVYYMSETLSQFVLIPTNINKIVTDKAFFLTDEVSETYYSAAQPTTSINTYNDSSRILLEFATSVEKIVTVNKRRYLKIPEILANLGGFVKAVLLISSFLCKTYSEFILFQDVLMIEGKHIKDNLSSSSLQSGTELKVSNLKKKIKLNFNDKISFWAYIISFFSRKRSESVDKNRVFKYLGLEYAITNFLFLEDLKRERENNFIEENN